MLYGDIGDAKQFIKIIFNPATSHVIPALIKKFHYAKIKSLCRNLG